jgi:hypothetical protein
MSHVRRFDHVGLTVADLDVVTAFFVALGLFNDLTCADDTPILTPGGMPGVYWPRPTPLRLSLSWPSCQHVTPMKGLAQVVQMAEPEGWPVRWKPLQKQTRHSHDQFLTSPRHLWCRHRALLGDV